MNLEPKYFQSLLFSAMQTNPYEDIFVSTDMTKAEQARHNLLVEQLKS